MYAGGIPVARMWRSEETGQVIKPAPGFLNY